MIFDRNRACLMDNNINFAIYDQCRYIAVLTYIVWQNKNLAFIENHRSLCGV